MFYSEAGKNLTFPKITWQDLYYLLEENTNIDFIPGLYCWCFNIPVYFFLPCFFPVYWNRFGCNFWLVPSRWLIFLFLHTALILNAGFPFHVFVMHWKIRQTAWCKDFGKNTTRRVEIFAKTRRACPCNGLACQVIFAESEAWSANFCHFFGYHLFFISPVFLWASIGTM